MAKEKSTSKEIINKLQKYTKYILARIIYYTKVLAIKLLNRLKVVWMKIVQFWAKTIAWVKSFESLERHEKFYRAGFILLYYTLILHIIFSPPLFKISLDNNGGFLFDRNNSISFHDNYETILSWFIIISFSFGYIIESINKLDKLQSKYKDRVIFKIIIASILFTVYAFSELLISNFINDKVGIDSNRLSDGKIILKLFFIPYAWLLLAFFYTLLVFLVSFVLGIYNINKHMLFMFIISPFVNNEWSKKVTKEQKRKEKRSWMLQIKLFATLVLIGVSLSAPLISGSVLQEIPKFFLIHSEYYRYSYCKNFIDKNILVADIGGGLYSVYNKQSKTFTERKCEVELTKLTVK